MRGALQVSAARISVRASCVAENGRRGSDDPSTSWLDTGVFADDRYFDVDVEYAKAAPDDVADPHHGRPTAGRTRRRCTCCRRCGSATPGPGASTATSRRSESRSAGRPGATDAIVAPSTRRWATYWLACRAATPELLFTENEIERASGCGARRIAHAVRQGRVPRRRSSTATASRVNPRATGPKPRRTTRSTLAPGDDARPCLRLSRRTRREPRSADAERARSPTRQAEADEFYAAVRAGAHDRRTSACVQRQAFAGLLWSKQFYHYDVARLARRRPGRAAAARPALARPQRATGGTSTTPTSSRCPTSGSTPGTPRGTWRFTASRWR